MSVRAHGVLALAGFAAAALALAAPGAANHRTPGAHGSLTTSWAKVKYSAYRRGWGALLSVSLADTKRDHSSVYLEAELAVAGWLDPDRTILRNRRGLGRTTSTRYLFHGKRLDPHGHIGESIGAVRLTVCRVRTGPDECRKSPWRTLPQQSPDTVPGYPDARAVADRLMAGTLQDFHAVKATAPPPFNWGDDGCSGPLNAVNLANEPDVLPFLGVTLPSGPRPTSFRPACERHDFGYRNLGYSNGGLQLAPTDAARRAIDGVFLRDMHSLCGADGNCLAWANLYWRSVRMAAGTAFFDDLRGNPPPTHAPVPPSLAAVTEVATGASHSCALHAAGVSCWGLNDQGQLGDGTTTLRTRPTAVELDRPRAVAAGGSHTCAVDAGGATCWGRNGEGQLGNGTTTSARVPVDVVGLADATAVTAGTAFSCALRPRGTVWCWGLNRDGRLGNGSTAASSVPVPVRGVIGATAVTAGGGHACALVVRGFVRCWGANARGQLGNGSTTSSAFPVTVSGLSGAVHISAGTSHTCAVLADGSMRCWGANTFGRLGDGTTTDRHVPVRVGGLFDAAGVAAGGSHTCARFQNPLLPPRCWGYNLHGQLGAGGGLTSVPIVVSGLALLGTSSRIAAGGAHSCAIVSGGRVACWGSNGQGQLGDGTRLDRATATLVAGG